MKKGIGPRGLGVSPLKQTNTTLVKSTSDLEESTKEKGNKGAYKSKAETTSLHKDMKDGKSTNTGAFLNERNVEKGGKGSYKSTYKGVSKSAKGDYTYNVTREKGEKGSSRSRTISENTAKRKMKRLEKKYNRKTR